MPTELMDILELIDELDEWDGRKKSKEWRTFRNSCAEKANELAKFKMITIVK